jgi:hypothetical protein
MQIYTPSGNGQGRRQASFSTARSATQCFHSWALLLILSLFPGAAGAARYYIDHTAGRDANSGRAKGEAWKLAPGMKGFAGNYRHTAGDQFCFKGGEMWPGNRLPLVVGFSGDSTNRMDVYGGLDPTWFTGNTWTNPIFADAQGVRLDGRSNVVVDGIRFLNSAKYGVLIPGVSAFHVGAFTIQNCQFEIHGGYGIKGGIDDGPSGPWRFLSNSFVATANASYFGVGDQSNGHTNAQICGMEIAYNTINGSSTNDGGSHPDGFQFSCADTGFAGNSDYTFRDVSFHHNRFCGDFLAGATAFFWVANMSNVLIYNNLFSFDNTNSVGHPMLNAPVYGGNSVDIRVFNNTFAGDANPNYGEGFQWCIFLTGPVTNLFVYNNIFSHCQNILAVNGAGPRTYANLFVDYNLYTQPRQFFFYLGSGNSGKWSDYRKVGMESHGLLTKAIGFAHDTSRAAIRPDWHLQADSAAIGVGTNLSAYFDTDLDGTARGPLWSMGAFEYHAADTGSGGTNQPPGTTLFRVIVPPAAP